MITAKIGTKIVLIRTPGEIQALRDESIRLATRRIMAAATIELTRYDAEMSRRERVAKRTKAPHVHY